MLAALMSGKGMSQRAIAAVLDVDQKTVSNDLRSGEENSSAVTDGLDGKNYKQKSKANPKRPPIRGDMRYAVDAVTKAVGRLSRVGDDDRFAGNRETLAYYRSDLQRAIDKLQEVVDKLGVDVAVVNP